MESGETYLGGFKSPHLVRGMMRGYELHATNKRLFGVKNRKSGAGWLLAAGMGGPVGGLVAGSMTPEQTMKTIQELEENKDFEVMKDQISTIEIKKAGSLTRGHLLVTLKAGEKVEVKIADKASYQPTLDLMQKFYPEVTKTV